MPAGPLFRYFLYSAHAPVGPGKALWSTLLPVHRGAPGAPADASDYEASVPLGAYFAAARRFLEAEDGRILVAALTEQTGRPVRSADLERVDIRLEKHGRFYHPARVSVKTPDAAADFVLNAALSPAGLQTVRQEAATLDRLRRRFSRSYIPRVYGVGDAPLDHGGRVGMFLGEWFAGFHEFHLSGDPSCRGNRIAAWDPAAGNVLLTEAQMRSLYRQAAGILTYYYNLETGEQIFPWHHAAGDFIVRTDGEGAALKLITVRKYQPLIDTGADPGRMIQGLFLFLVNMSIRMRLDRLDGDGAVAWAPALAAAAAVEGFFEALAEKPVPEGLPDPFPEVFMAYAAACSTDDFLELAETIAGAWCAGAPELPLIRARLQDHARALRRCFAEM